MRFSRKRQGRSFWLLLLCITLLLGLAPTSAWADVVSLPLTYTDNAFCNEHGPECPSFAYPMSFTLRDQGAVRSVSAAPGSADTLALIPAGAVFAVIATYTGPNDTAWGLVRAPQNEWSDGWVAMDELELEYNAYTFGVDHQSEFTAYAGDSAALQSDTAAVIWEWPGSGIIDQTVDLGTVSALYVATSYTDADGRQWLYLSCLDPGQGKGVAVAGWLCASAAADTGIPAYDPPHYVDWQPAYTDPDVLAALPQAQALMATSAVTPSTSSTPASPGQSKALLPASAEPGALPGNAPSSGLTLSAILLIAGLAAVLAVAAIILIRLFVKSKNREKSAPR